MSSKEVAREIYLEREVYRTQQIYNEAKLKNDKKKIAKAYSNYKKALKADMRNKRRIMKHYDSSK